MSGDGLVDQPAHDRRRRGLVSNHDHEAHPRRLAGQRCSAEPKRQVFDVVPAGLVEPVRIVDHQESWDAAAQVLVDRRRAELDLGSDVSTFGNGDELVVHTEIVCLGDKPVDQGGLTDARRPVDHDHDRLSVDCGCQPSRQVGALRDSPDDVDHH